MGCKLLSLIGPTKYIEAYYKYDDRVTEDPCMFIQEALVEFFCKEWRNGDEVVVFMTEESKRRNWLSKCDYKEANFEDGLKNRLSNIIDKLNLSVKVKEVIIPEGKSEQELWKIFEIINENINDNDKLTCDVTHSFRFLPMLTLISLNYAKFLKNVEIERILYGAMEALGSPREVSSMPLPERIIPVFDLTPFVNLFDWTIAVERFLNTGDAEMITALGRKDLTPMLAKTKGKVGGKLRDLIEKLDEFSKDVVTCRAYNFKHGIKRIKDLIPEAEKDIENLKPFKPLFGKIKDRFIGMHTDDQSVFVSLDATYWCIDNNLIQQGYTILREAIVNYVIANLLNGSELHKKELRAEAEDMLNEKDKVVPKDILNLWHEIVEYRNDINHAGWREKNLHDYNSFKNKLKNFADRFKGFLKNKEK